MALLFCHLGQWVLVARAWIWIQQFLIWVSLQPCTNCMLFEARIESVASHGTFMIVRYYNESKTIQATKGASVYIFTIYMTGGFFFFFFFG